MAKFIGRRVAVGLGRETTRGTGVAPGHWIPHTNISFREATENVRSLAAINQIADSEQKQVIESWAEGDIEGEIRDESFGLLLIALAGAAPSTSGSDPYTHTYTLENSNQHDTLSIYLQDPIGDQLFKFGMLNSLELSQDLSGFAMFTANFLAKKPVSTSVTPSFASESKFNKSHLSVKIAADISSLSGASDLGIIEQVRLTINKNVVRDSVHGTAEPIDFLNNSLSVEGELVLKYEDRTYRDYMLDGSYKALELHWNAGASQQIQIQMPRVDFIDWEPDYALDDVVRQTVPFKANYDVANSQNIIHTLKLINSTASY